MPVAYVNFLSLDTFSAIGKEVSVLDDYREAELLSEEGPGCLTHMWFGGDWPAYEKTRLRVYVDGETRPSIDMEMGLGHGYGFGDGAAPWGTEKMGKTGHPSGVYNTYKIPFGTSIRVTAQRSEEGPAEAAFWWIVRGTKNLPRHLRGGAPAAGGAAAALHAGRPRRPAAGRVRPVRRFGRGGTVPGHDGGRKPPKRRRLEGHQLFRGHRPRLHERGSGTLLLSSGLEDYFLGTYYFNRGLYANRLAGLTHLDTEKNAFSAYRFHDDDPLFFRDGFRLTCRCGEELNGAMLHDPPPTRFTTYTWLYQW